MADLRYLFEMRATDLRNNNMLYVIPKEFRNMTPNTREEPWMISFEDYS